MKMTMNFKTWCIQNQCFDLLRYYELADNELDSENIAWATAKVVNFQCDVCNLTWKMQMNHATRRPEVAPCPYCNHRKVSPFYNFEILFPGLSKYVDLEMNQIGPDQMFPNSKKVIYWKCKYGHSWKNSIANQIRVFNRNHQDICPVCFKRKKSSYYNLMITHPEVARQWDYVKNAGLSPENFAPAGSDKVWWICDFNSNHRWASKISNRTVLQRGCPICAKEWKISYPSLVLFYYLYQVSPDAKCEVSFQKKYKIDIVLEEKKIAIEHNGFYYHHDQYCQKKDFKKMQQLKEEGYRTLTVQDSDTCKEIKIEEDLITYPFERQYKTLDEMVLTVLKVLGLPLIEVNHKKDKSKIDYFYYHIRKMQTLAYKRPDLAKEWSLKNQDLPDTISDKSSKQVWWKCPKCEQEYQSSVVSRVNLNSGCPYCANMKIYEKNCLATKRPDLVDEWFQEKNGSFTPYNVGTGTEFKAWWKCKKGHVWQSYIYTRTGPGKSNCPYCSHNLVTLETSLYTVSPDLAVYWNKEKNSPLTPKDVTASSNKVFWWKCENGHEWKMTPNKMQRIRSKKYCPYCHFRKISPDNSLAKNFPDLVKEWDYERNGKLEPDMFTYRSKKRVWWKRNHQSWMDSIYNRTILGIDKPTHQRNCQAKFGENLQVLYPNLAEEWNFERNGELKPNMVTPGSGKKVWWKCKYGHEWETSIAKRTSRGSECPYCSLRLASPTYSLEVSFPEIAKEWDYEKNGSLKPNMVTPKSGKKVWWKCAHGHEWESSICNRTLRNHKCPKCPRTNKYTNLAVDFPEIAQEWNFEKNEKGPSDYKPHSNIKVWWKCKNGHEWMASPDSRVNHTGCPQCYKERVQSKKTFKI